MMTAPIFYGAGVRWLRRVGARKAVILGYHRVVDTTWDPYGLAVSPAHFAEHLDVIKRLGEPFRLSELVNCLKSGQIPDRAVVITLDDGSEMNVHGSTDEKGVFVVFEEVDDTSSLEDALLVRTDESNAREIMNSSNPAYTLRLALKEKTVIIENASLFESIVLWFAKSSLADILF